MKCVLDASAVLAMVQNEPGKEVVLKHIEGATISVVNFIEVATRLLDSNSEIKNLPNQFFDSGLSIIPLDVEVALSAANLRVSTRHKGLSLADRVCLALAIRENAIALTADKIWADLNIGCKIELIR